MRKLSVFVQVESKAPCELIYVYAFSFSVQSPWAVVFSNKLITTADRLKAIIYALDHNEFHALTMICGRQIS